MPLLARSPQLPAPQLAAIRKKGKVYAVRRHDGSPCTQKQPKTAALKANQGRDPMGVSPAVICTDASEGPMPLDGRRHWHQLYTRRLTVTIEPHSSPALFT